MIDVPSSPDNENPEIDFKNLKFEDLKRTFEEVRELATNTFHQTEYGFINADGSGGISVAWRSGKFYMTGVSESLRDIHSFLCLKAPHLPVFKGSPDREEVMREVRAMLEGLGKRVIE